MAETSGKSLKTRNMKWLVLLAFVDAALVVGLTSPRSAGDVAPDELFGKLLAPGTLPLLILIVLHVLPAPWKFALVYWKGRNGLPGAQAFTRWGPADPRVDMDVIERQFDRLPSSPDDQNRAWFKLYRAVEQAPAVEQAHQMSLLFRDMAALSALLAVAIPLVTWWATRDLRAALIAFAIFAGQYIIAMVCGRSSGSRFVSNVLAEHSVKPDAAVKRPRKR